MQGLRAMLAALQQDLDTEVAHRDSDAATKAALQQRAAAAEERADRAERERSQGTSSLQNLVGQAAKVVCGYTYVREWQQQAFVNRKDD